jgi:iron complex transport system substrate-binding protein
VIDVELDDITGAIVDAAVRIHREVGPGLFESLYEALLASELARRGLRVERQRLISCSFDGVNVEDAFRADLMVEERVIVEVKSLERLAPVHAKQLLTYLRLTDLRVGLLLNFGAETMKEGMKRMVNNYTASSSLLRINHPR